MVPAHSWYPSPTGSRWYERVPVRCLHAVSGGRESGECRQGCGGFGLNSALLASMGFLSLWRGANIRESIASLRRAWAGIWEGPFEEVTSVRREVAETLTAEWWEGQASPRGPAWRHSPAGGDRCEGAQDTVLPTSASTWETLQEIRACASLELNLLRRRWCSLYRV